MGLTKTFGRSDLVYRDIAEKKGGEIADERVTRILEKVIQYLDSSDPSEWTPHHWQVIKILMKERGTHTAPQTTEEMSTDDFLKSITGAE